MQDNNWKYRRNRVCTKFPNLYELKYINMDWQEFKAQDGTYYIYRAYYDNRQNGTQLIRILGMFDNQQPVDPVHCQVESVSISSLCM